MADFDAARAHEREMLRPAFGLDRTDQARETLDAFGRRRARGGEAEAGAVEVNRALASEGTEGAQLLRAVTEVVVGHQLEHVDVRERVENAGCECRTPRQAKAITRNFSC